MILSMLMDVQSFVFFFFFKQKTAYEMRISDWSSDVCSSDLGIADVQRSAPGKGLPVASAARRQHAIEHVDPAFDRTDNVVRLAHAHQVTGLVGGQHVRREIQRGEHCLLPLAHCKAADSIAIEADIYQPVR